MIGRLLCKMRLHKWSKQAYKNAVWIECERCEKVKGETQMRPFSWENDE